jgi:hypothetical protein
MAHHKFSGSPAKVVGRLNDQLSFSQTEMNVNGGSPSVQFKLP